MILLLPLSTHLFPRILAVLGIYLKTVYWSSVWFIRKPFPVPHRQLKIALSFYDDCRVSYEV